MKKNIFNNIPESIPDEIFETIIESDSIKVERIISKGQSSPPDFWYDQDQNEWVILLKGRAGLLFEGNNTPIELKPGDYHNIPAHTKHRVEWTDPDIETVWLAIMWDGD